jgi:hypothetical protein
MIKMIAGIITIIVVNIVTIIAMTTTSIVTRIFITIICCDYYNIVTSIFVMSIYHVLTQSTCYVLSLTNLAHMPVTYCYVRSLFNQLYVALNRNHNRNRMLRLTDLTVLTCICFIDLEFVIDGIGTPKSLNTAVLQVEFGDHFVILPVTRALTFTRL